MSARGRRRVEQRFTWRVAAEGHVEQWRLRLEDVERARHDAAV